MRTILMLLVVVTSCSSSAPPASGQPADTPRQPQPPPAMEKPSEPPPSPAAVYSDLTGIQWVPADMVESLPSEESQLVQRIFSDEKIQCAEVELKGLRSKVPFRLVDAEAEALLSDARKIGWQFKARKSWLDAALYDARWHGETRVVALLFGPLRLSIGICRPMPTAPPPAKPAR
jgi:hypothetical protein